MTRTTLARYAAATLLAAATITGAIAAPTAARATPVPQLRASQGIAGLTTDFVICNKRQSLGSYCLTRQGSPSGDAFPGQKVITRSGTAQLGFAARWDATIVRYPFGKGVPSSWLDTAGHRYLQQEFLHPAGWPGLYVDVSASGGIVIGTTRTVWLWDENGDFMWSFVVTHGDADPGDGSYPLVLTAPEHAPGKQALIGPFYSAGSYLFWYAHG
jgi:hypothetical protein